MEFSYGINNWHNLPSFFPGTSKTRGPHNDTPLKNVSIYDLSYAFFDL